MVGWIFGTMSLVRKVVANNVLLSSTWNYNLGLMTPGEVEFTAFVICLQFEFYISFGNVQPEKVLQNSIY